MLNYINDETDSKKGKNKKKRKKNKKQNGNKEDEKNNDVNNNDKNYCEGNNDEDFDKIFEEFKKDIENNTIYVYDINKIKPVLSDDFITNKCSN